jgi:hypothetical protein
VGEGGRETAIDGNRDGGVEALQVLVAVAAVGRRPSQARLLPDQLAMLATLILISGLSLNPPWRLEDGASSIMRKAL